MRATATTLKERQEQRTQDAIKDVLNLGIFEPGEVTPYEENKTPYTILKSIEYYNILHFTNEALYYLDEEQENNLRGAAEEIHETEKGIIFCFK